MMISIGIPLLISSALHADKAFGDFSEFETECHVATDCFLLISAEVFIKNLRYISTKTDMDKVVVFIPDATPDLLSTPKIISQKCNLDECAQIFIVSQKSDEGDVSSHLTARETDVLKEIATGKTFKEIADCLNISTNTVMTHRKNISAKLGIRSISGLSLYAMMNGLLK